jgi:hypothetical protein
MCIQYVTLFESFLDRERALQRCQLGGILGDER